MGIPLKKNPAVLHTEQLSLLPNILPDYGRAINKIRRNATGVEGI
jgi:hypothetical protein